MPGEVIAVPVYVVSVVSVLAASALGGLIAIANMVVGKEQKISEARKDWIDGLRTNLAAFFASAQVLSLLWESHLHLQTSGKDNKEHLKLSPREVLKFRTTHKELYERMLAAYHDVQLRLGTNPVEFGCLIAELDEVYRAFEGNTTDCHLYFRRREPTLRVSSSKAMKAEWVKVRDGEPTFQKVKTFFYRFLTLLGIVFFVGLVLLVWIHK